MQTAARPRSLDIQVIEALATGHARSYNRSLALIQGLSAEAVGYHEYAAPNVRHEMHFELEKPVRERVPLSSQPWDAVQNMQ
jgi:hypothetical protein